MRALSRSSRSCESALERSRERVGVSPDDLQRVVGAALARAGCRSRRRRERRLSATPRPSGSIPNDPAFAKEPGWQDTFDDLRERPRKRGERIGEWRKRVPIRAIAFEPPRLPDGRDAPEIVQVHLEHRLVRRLLSRFLSQGFQAGLSRISVIEGPGAQPRVVLMGRLAVYGAGAARLHEEIIPVTAIWTEADRDTQAASGARRERRGAHAQSARGRAAPRPGGADDGGRARAGAGRARHRRSRACVREDRRGASGESEGRACQTRRGRSEIC